MGYYDTLARPTKTFKRGDRVMGTRYGMVHYGKLGTVSDPYVSLSGPAVWVDWDSGRRTHSETRDLTISHTPKPAPKATDYSLGDTVRNALGEEFVIDRKEPSCHGIGNFYAGKITKTISSAPWSSVAIAHDKDGVTLVSAKTPAKLAKGDVVTIGGGGPEWEVEYVGHKYVELRRGMGMLAEIDGAGISELVVVKSATPPAPAPVKYYANAEGEPQNGDIFLGENKAAVQIKGDKYVRLAAGTSYPLKKGAFRHSLDAKSPAVRTLLIRGGKQYVGSGV